MRVVLTYWEALRDVSELSYKSLLYFSSNGSYCNCICNFANVLQKALNKYEMRKWEILITHFGGFGSPFCSRAPSIFSKELGIIAVQARILCWPLIVCQSVWNLVWIRFLDNFNILALCDQLWKIQTLGPLFKTFRSFPYLGTWAASESWFGVKYAHQTLDYIGLFSILQPICPELEYSTAVVSFLFISNPTPWSDYVTPTLHPDTALVSSSCPSST